MGKARSFSDLEDDVVYQTESNNENYVMSSQQNAYNLGSVHFSDQSGIGNFSQSGFDQSKADLKGALFRGNIGFELQSAFLDSTTDTINLLVDQSNNPVSQTSTDRIPIISGIGNTADLVTILGAQRPGQRLFLYGIQGNTITIKNTATATDNTILTPGATDFTLTNTEVVELVYDTTTTKWRIVGSVGGGGTSFPILYPKEDLTPAIAFNQTIDLSVNTGNAKQIQFPAGDIGLQIIGDPANTVGEDVYVLFIQDSVGGRSLSTVDSTIKNGSLMDTLLDKAADAKTLFRLATLDGGVSYHAILVDLSTAAGGLLSTLSIDVNKDWNQKSISNFGGLVFLPFGGISSSIVPLATGLEIGSGDDNTIKFLEDSSTTLAEFGNANLDFYLNNVKRFEIEDNTDNAIFTDLSLQVLETIGSTSYTIGKLNGSTLLSEPTLIRQQIAGSDIFRITITGIEMFKDIDMNTFNIFDIDQARFVNDSGVVSSSSDNTILVNSSNQFQFNTAQANDFAFSIENIAALIIDRNPSTNDQVTVSVLSDSTNTNSTANFNLTRSFEPAVSFQIIGQIGFRAPDDTNAGTLEYAAIVGKIEDATAGSLDGSLSFDATLDNSATQFMIINESSSGVIRTKRDLDLVTNDILNIDRAKFVVDSGVVGANSDNTILVNSGNQFQFNTAQANDFAFSIENIVAFVIDRDPSSDDIVTTTVLSDSTNTNSTANFNLTRTFEPSVSGQTIGQIGFRAPDDTNAGTLEYAAIKGEIEDATAGSLDGSLSFEVTLNNSVTQFMRINEASSDTVEILKDLDMSASDIIDIGTISFTTGTGSIIGASSPLGMTFNLGGANTFLFVTGAEEILDITQAGLTMRGTNNIALAGNDVTGVNQIAFNTGITNKQTITENVNGMRFSLPDTLDTFDFTIDSDGTANTPVSIEKFFLNLSNTRIQMTQNTDPADPIAGDIFVYAKLDSSISKLFYKQSDGTVVGPLGAGGGTGDVVGPGSSTDNAIVRFNGTTGKIIQNSGILINDSNSMSGVASILFASSGGQIANSASAPQLNFVLTGTSIFRFTTDASNILDIDTNGLTMTQGNIALGNGNVTGVNQIAFDISGQTITDNVNGMRFSLPDATDSYDFTIDSNLNLSIEKFFINFFNSRLEMTQEIDPADPIAGDIFVYSKLDSGIAKLFYKQSDGTVVGPLGAGAAGANTALSNLAATTSINSNLLPASDASASLGSDTVRWNNAFVNILNIQDDTSATPSSSAVTIVADTGGMKLGVIDNDDFEFFFDGTRNIRLGEDEIEFLKSGRQHQIIANSNNLTLTSDDSGDTINLFPGSSRTNEALNCGNLQTRVLSASGTTTPYEFNLEFTNAITTGQPGIGNIGFLAEDSVNVTSAYVAIATAIDDDTSSSRDGRVQIVVANNNGAAQRGPGQLTGVGLDIQSDAGTMKLGFFGVTPVARQSPTASSASIISALEALGLFV